MNDLTQANAERRAWRILVSFFVVFLLLCGSSIYFAQWYIFQSTVGLDADLKVARGTVSIILPNTQEAIAVTNERLNLTAGTIIHTDEKSQAILTFRDPHNDQHVASVVIFRDSEIVLTQASSPRFGLNAAPYRVQLTSRSGHSELSVLKNTQRAVQCEINTPQAAIYLSESGLYTIETTSQRTRLMVRSGKATIVERNTKEQSVVSENNRVIIDSASGKIEPLLPEQPLIANDSFNQKFQPNWEFRTEGKPAGSVRNVTFDGRPAAVIDRSQSNWPSLTLDHGQTGLVQVLKKNVEPFDSLELRATFYIEEQELQICGVDGSECPLMIRITYRDASGAETTLFHGFYAQSDNSQGYPLICNSCRSEHERIALKSWYTYSENLISLFPVEQRPVFIHEIYFYASGHAYKVYVSELSLLGAPKPESPKARLGYDSLESSLQFFR